MIKIISKKRRNIIKKDGNKLGVRKMYQINKFEFTHKIKPGIILYTKSIEDLELHKNDNVWYIGGVIDEGVYIITLSFNGFVHKPAMTIKQAISLLNKHHEEESNKKYILLKANDDSLFIPKIDF